MHALSYHTTVALVLALLPPAAVRAAPFVNLNFEQATVPQGTQFSLAAEVAFPGWTPRLNETVLTFVYYNHFGIGEPAVALYDQPDLSLGLPVFEGAYSAALIGDTASIVRASLSQMGDVPSDTRSLRLLADRIQPPVLSMDGTAVPLVLLFAGPISAPSLFGADISMFAGKPVELRLSSPLSPNGVIAGVDSIVFSPDPIPEPSLGTLACLTLLLASRRMHQNNYREECNESESSSR